MSQWFHAKFLRRRARLSPASFRTRNRRPAPNPCCIGQGKSAPHPSAAGGPEKIGRQHGAMQQANGHILVIQNADCQRAAGLRGCPATQPRLRRPSCGGTRILRVDNGAGIAPPVARSPMLASPGCMPRPLCCACIRHRSTYFDEIVQLQTVFTGHGGARNLCRTAALQAWPKPGFESLTKQSMQTPVTVARLRRPVWTPDGSRDGNARTQHPRTGLIRPPCSLPAATRPGWL